MTFQSQLKLALIACTFVFSISFGSDDAAGQCWRKHNTVLPQTYPIWTMWNGIDPYQRISLPPLGPTLTTCVGCASVPAAANVWVADDAAVGEEMVEAPAIPMVPLVPAEPAQEVDLPDADSSPSDVITAPPTPEDVETEQDGSDELAELKQQLEEATQRGRAAEERAYASEKSARAAQAEAEKRIAELEKEIEESKID